MTQNNSSLKKLLELTTNKQTLALEILRLTREQANILKTGDGKEASLIKLQQLLDQKQNCINRIDNINNEISNLKINYHSLPLNCNKELLETINQTRINIKEIFKETQALDIQGRQKIQNIMKNLTKQMKSLQAGKASSHAYMKKYRQAQGFFVDKKK